MASVSKDGVPRYVVTGPPQGESLARVVERKGPMHPGPAASATLQILSALNAIHTKNCHHGNLNPESVTLFTSEGGEMEISLMHHGSVSFDALPEDPSFLSPEQVLGEGNVDARSDLWSVGVLLYFLVYGRLPFVGGDKDEISGKILLKDPGFPMDARIPEELRAVVRKSLEKEPARRYEDVTAMVGDLLVLHAKYDEAMSSLVRDALRKSVPPPPSAQPVRIPAPRPMPKITEAKKAASAAKGLGAQARPAIHPPASKKTMLGIPSPVKKEEPERSERSTLPTPPDSADLAAAADSSWDLHDERPTTPVDEAQLEALKSKVKPLPAPLPNLAPKGKVEKKEAAPRPKPELKKEPAPRPKPEPKKEPAPRPKPEPKKEPAPRPKPKPEPKKEPAPQKETEPAPPPIIVEPPIAKTPAASQPLVVRPSVTAGKGEPSGYAMLADSLEDTDDIDTTALPLGPTGGGGIGAFVQRRKALVLGAGAAFLVAAVIILILALSGGGTDDPDGDDTKVTDGTDGTEEAPVGEVEAPAATAETPEVEAAEEHAVEEEPEPTADAEEAADAEEQEAVEPDQGGGDSSGSGGGYRNGRDRASEGESDPAASSSEPAEPEQKKKTKPRRKKEGAWASNPFGG